MLHHLPQAGFLIAQHPSIEVEQTHRHRVALQLGFDGSEQLLPLVLQGDELREYILGSCLRLVWQIENHMQLLDLLRSERRILRQQLREDVPICVPLLVPGINLIKNHVRNHVHLR